MKSSISMSRRSFAGAAIVLAGNLLVPSSYALATEENNDTDVVLTVSYDEKDSFFGGISTCAWFGSTLSMSGVTEYTGSTREYDGSNMGIEMTCYTMGSSTGNDTYFSVELHRKTGVLDVIDTYIGSAAFKRNGFTKATWTNVGSGRYCFKFVKCSDSQSIHSDNVAMYSW